MCAQSLKVTLVNCVVDTVSQRPYPNLVRCTVGRCTSAGRLSIRCKYKKTQHKKASISIIYCYIFSFEETGSDCYINRKWDGMGVMIITCCPLL